MAIRIAMDSDRLKRLQSPQMTQIRAPQGSPMPSNEPSGMQQLGSYVTGKAADKYAAPLVDKGLAKVAGMFSPAAAAAPTAAQFAGLKAAAPVATGAGIAPGMAQAILVSGSAAAPLVAQTAGMTGAGLAGTTAAGLGTAAGTSAAAAGAGAGAAPMLAALGPVGMAIGAGLLMKQFGLFSSKGGHVGPLYSATGSAVPTPQGISPVPDDPNTPEDEYQNFLDNYDPDNYNLFGPKNPIPLSIDNNVYEEGYTGFRTQGTPEFDFGDYDDTNNDDFFFELNPEIYTPPSLTPPVPVQNEPTTVDDYYVYNSFGPNNWAIASQKGEYERNPNAWEFQVGSGGQDEIGYVPIGGWDNYWNAMDIAAGGQGTFGQGQLGPGYEGGSE